MKTRRLIYQVTALLFMLSPVPTYALQPVHARTLALGTAGATTAVGIDVVGYNPAFLAFKDQPGMTFSLPLLNIGVRAGDGAFTAGDLEDYYEGGRFWSLEDRLYLSNDVEDDLLRHNTDFYMRLFGISFETEYLDLALTYDVGGSVDSEFNQNLFNALVPGSAIDKVEPQELLDGRKGSMQSASRIGFTVAKSFRVADEIDGLDQFTAGATFSYFIGHSYLDMDNVDESVDTPLGADPDGTEYGFFEAIGSGVMTPGEQHDMYDNSLNAASGVGLDLALAISFAGERGRLGASFINLASNISWDEGTRYLYAYRLDGMPIQGFDEGDAYADSNFVQIDSLSGPAENLRTTLPRLFRLDGSYQISDDWMIASNITGQPIEIPGSDAHLRGGIGGEYTGFTYLPLRAGLSYDGRDGLGFGLGFGVYAGPVRADVGFAWRDGLLNSANGYQAGLNIVIVLDAGMADSGAQEEDDF